MSLFEDLSGRKNLEAGKRLTVLAEGARRIRLGVHLRCRPLDRHEHTHGGSLALDDTPQLPHHCRIHVAALDAVDDSTEPTVLVGEVPFSVDAFVGALF